MSDNQYNGNFEGVEKRIIVQLKKGFFKNQSIKSLLDLEDEIWDKKLSSVGCMINSKINEDLNVDINRRCRAYLLSESSLFVYEDRLFLKTCGKTKALFFIPIFADLLLNIDRQKEGSSEEDQAYDENWIKCSDRSSLIQFMERNFEYVLFTHMNYKNHKDDQEDVFLQEYPHKTVAEEKEFFAFFFKHMQFVTTSLPQNKTHHIFYARLNYSMSFVDAKFCSEFVAFLVNNTKVKKDFHHEYLSEDALQVLQNEVEFMKMHELPGDKLQDILIGESVNDPSIVKTESEGTPESTSFMDESLFYIEKGNAKTGKATTESELFGVTDTMARKAGSPNLYLGSNHPENETREKEQLCRKSCISSETTSASSRNLSGTSALVEKEAVPYNKEKSFVADMSKEYVSDFSAKGWNTIYDEKDEHMGRGNANQCLSIDVCTQFNGHFENEEQHTLYADNKVHTENVQLQNSKEMGKLEDIELIKHCTSSEKNTPSHNINYFTPLRRTVYDDTYTSDRIVASWNVDSDYEEAVEGTCVEHDTISYEYVNKKNQRFMYNEFYFTPCGFSCNAVNETNSFCTHYSPEEAISYVSVEVVADLNIEAFVNFIKKQMKFYSGKYVYLINYVSTVDDSNGNSSSEPQEGSMQGITTDTAKSYYLKAALNNIFTINKNRMYYKLLSFEEQTIDFFRVQYLAFELKSLNKSTLSKPHMNAIYGDLYSGDGDAVEDSHQRFAKLKYSVAYKFCKKNKIPIVQVNPLDSSVAGVSKWHSKLEEKQLQDRRIRKEESKETTVQRDVTNEKEIHKENGANVDKEALRMKTIQMDNIARAFENNTGEMYMLQKVLHENIDTSVMCINIGKIVSQYVRFKRNFPNITPFYSIKSNNDETIIKLLYELNCNFDCASKGEISLLLKLVPNISRDRIIYANTIKNANSLVYAQSENVNLCTFDNLEELKKIAKWHPTCSLILRINVDFGNCTSYMSTKYGANKHEWKHLFKFAKSKGLRVKGISFHVGSNNKYLNYYCEAIRCAREAWNCAERIGFHMEILNIGGGFPEELEEELIWHFKKQKEQGMEAEEDIHTDSEHSHVKRKPRPAKLCNLSDEEIKSYIHKILNDKVRDQMMENVIYTFEHMSLAIKMSISHYFKDKEHTIKVMCEPGRFFVGGCAVLAVKVVGKRYPLRDRVNYTDIALCEAKQSRKIPREKYQKRSTNMIPTDCENSNSILENEQFVDEDMSETGDSSISLPTGVNKAIMDNITNLNNDNVKLAKISDIKKKVVDTGRGQHNFYAYYINESIYGCFSNIIFDEYNRPPVYVIKNKKNTNLILHDAPLYQTTIFGQSCDGLDMITSETYLPSCNINDWILYEYTGAYSIASASTFNGFDKCKKVYIFSKKNMHFLK